MAGVESFVPTETLRLALATSAERESRGGVPSRAVEGRQVVGFDAFVKRLGASDSGVNGQVLLVMNLVKL